MANDIIIPPSVADGVDALSNLPSPSDALSMFGNDIAAGFNAVIGALAGSSGATEVTGKISQIISGSPPAHSATVAALIPIEDMYTTIITSGEQSGDMVTHVGHLQKSMPLVLKKAGTVNAMVVATKYTSPDCSSNIIFPIGSSGDDATSAVAGTTTERGDALQDDVKVAIDDLVDILDAPDFNGGGDSYTNQLLVWLDIISGDNSGNYSAQLAPFTLLAVGENTAPAGTAAIITEKGNLIDSTALAERANVGLPNLDGSAIILGSPPVEVVPAGDPEAIQMGAGYATADIKKKALGLQAHGMASTPCQKNILTRSEGATPAEVAGISAIASKADAISAKDENDFSVADDPSIAVAADEVVITEETDQAAVDGDNVGKVDSVTWNSEVQKITPLIYNSEEGLKFIARLIIPEQSNAMKTKFPVLDVTGDTTLYTEWVYPESMVITDFFGNNMMRDSLKGEMSQAVGDNLYTELYKQFGTLTKYGISVFKNKDTSLDAGVYNYIPDPDMVGFNIILSMEDINGDDPTTDAGTVGNCRTVIFDGNIKKGVAIGPVEGIETGFWFVKTHVNSNTAFTTWIEGPDSAIIKVKA